MTLKIIGSAQQRKFIRDPATTGHLCAYPLRENMYDSPLTFVMSLNSKINKD
jgi:hypothetical protein